MSQYDKAMLMAINAAEQFQGNTAPNPPVGAIALDKNGKVLLGAAHERAGLHHAEAKLLDLAGKLGKLAAIETIVVTLEPCNHHGKTPPCTLAILKHKNIKRVVYGARDPDSSVVGKGHEALAAKGIEVISGVKKDECEFLIRAFTKSVTKHSPYVTIKAAFTKDGSMIPPEGQKTFTSQPALAFAHTLRKRADAIWTGSGTVLADKPEFTVRHVPDFPGKKRHLVLSDRRRRIPAQWLEATKKRGFEIFFANSFSEGLEYLNKNKCLEVLIEAGPALRSAWLESSLWDESVVIKQTDQDETIEINFNEG